jgi:hypothetical protein
MPKNKKEKNIIVFVMTLPRGAVDAVKRLQRLNRKKYKTLLLRDTKIPKSKRARPINPNIDIFVECDFSKPSKIAQALQPYQNEICAVTCRGDGNIGKFISVIPHVPYLRTPTTESLEWATDKHKMRRRFTLLAKKYSPKYVIVKGNTKKERKRIIDKIGFPMILKPTNLAESFLVTKCYHEEELEKAIRTAQRKIRNVYKESGRTEEPRIMVEEFVEGDLYSVDAYVNSRGAVYFCPMVKVLTGKNIGHDDFYNYMHMSPTALKKTSIEKAHEAAEAGIHALGLRNTTAHVELIKVDDEWKLVEIGPRIGGFRDKLHKLSCDIDHSLNDILIRMPKKPVIPKKCKGYAATLKWYPKKEGIIKSLKGLKKMQKLKSFKEMKHLRKVGERAKFAKHGGKAIFTVTLYNAERAKLLADIRRIEQMVEVQM